ncbi:hypothetical protein HY382_01345 [Candidatus Curtissbacteria bacterium]|nr:hypothetical protein [Candidatus Curtissbacteria bacterium]
MIEIKPDGLGSSAYWANPFEEEEGATRSFSTFSTYREYLEHMFDQGPNIGKEGADVLLESWEMGIEAQKLFFNPIYRDKNIKRGDGSFVTFVPGFLGSELVYYLPKLNLRGLNWDAKVLPSRYFFHVEPTERMFDPLVKHSKERFKESGKKGHLIGHSKGGHVILCAAMLRGEELAKYVDQIIIVDSPIPNKVNLQVGISYLLAQIVFRGNDFGLTKLARDVEGLESIEKRFRLTTLKVKSGKVIDGLHVGSVENQFEVESSHPGAVHKPENLLFIHSRLLRSVSDRYGKNGAYPQAA